MAMGLVRKLVLSCALALVAAALAASTASAQEAGLEAVDEDLSGHCNPCVLHASGETQATVHMLGMEVGYSSCLEELELHLGENMTGTAQNYQSFSHGTPPDCFLTGCNGVGEAAQEVLWPITNPGEVAPNEGHLRIRMCFDRPGEMDLTGVHCTIEARFEENPTVPHHYFFLINDQPCGMGGGELDGFWGTEVNSEKNYFDIEVVHP
jgi:hypothetical protein